MKKLPYPLDLFFRHAAFGFALFSAFGPTMANAADRSRPPVNEYGAPVLDAKGQRVTYDQKKLESMARAMGHLIDMSARPSRLRIESVTPPPRPQPTPFPRPTPQPPRSGPDPFWQYAIFGSGIGASNVLIGPASGQRPEIIVGGSSQGSFWGNDFWQSIRSNPVSGNYDQTFVSPIYRPREGESFVTITRIGLAHVTSTSDWQLVVMLEDGRIYLYDLATKADAGYVDTGIYGLRALSLTDLDGDGHAELIVTNDSDLYVFSSSGQLLWSVAGAGGYDVVAGQMDNDPAIEIAATNGLVIDGGTHANQWTYGGGFGVHLKLAPFPGENYQQLISATGWQFVYSYDVDRQLPRWSIQTPQDIGAIDIADIDADGVPEVLIGDGQWGTVHVHDLITQALKWQVNNPEHGVTNIAVADVDDDGAIDLLWGAGYSSTGADYLYIANTTGEHDIKWQSIDLQGPFLGPAIGDLDGDGRLELVICSPSSNADYDSGRILVFDFPALSLRAISAPVVDNTAWTGVHDFKLRDFEGTARMDIVIASSYIYDGAFEVYRFDSDNSFTRICANAIHPIGNPFNFVEVADLDNNGTRKIICGAEGDYYNGTYVYVYDYPSGAQSWQSINLANSNRVAGLIVQDLNGNGNDEIVALTDNGDLYTWDGPTRQLRNLRQGTNGTLLSNRATAAGLVLGDMLGVGHFLQWSNDAYTENFTRQLGTNCDPYGYYPCINGLNVTADNALWTGTSNVLIQRLAPSYDTVAWESVQAGNGVGRFVTTAVINGQDCVFSSDQHAVMGLTIAPPSTPTPTPHPRATPRPRATPPARP